MISSLPPRWRKVISDARTARGRFILLLVAMLLSFAAVTALLVANAILNRELSRSFLDSNPASAILRMDDADDNAIEMARAWRGVKVAEAAGTMAAKIQTREGEWLPIALTVVSDFTSTRIDTFASVSGAWPPPAGTLLIERSGIGLLGAADGSSVVIESLNGVRLTMPIAGLVHDQTRPPSTQEMTIYGYITSTTMQQLDATERVNRLKIVVEKPLATAQDIEAIVRPLAVRLRESGHRVHLVEIPPPGEHPHQWQYELISRLLLAFSLLGLALESALLAVVVAGLLAPQVRQIAVMKAIGARTRQLASMYLTLVGLIALSAVVIGIPTGMALGYMLVDFVARVVNVAIQSYAVDWWVIALCIVLGLSIPLIATLVPILAVSRRTIRESLDDHGVAKSADVRELQRWIRFARWGDSIIQSAVRNTFRRRIRLALTVALLTIAGVVFLIGGNLLNVWQNVAESASKQRRFDMQVVLRAPQPRESLLRLASLEGVQHVEIADAMRAYLDRGDAVAIAGLGRNSLTLRFTPARTNLMRPEILEGRWLRDDDTHAIVLNSAARAGLFPQVRVGDTVKLVINAHAIDVRVVGVIVEQLTEGAGYATPSLYDTVADAPGRSQSARVGLLEGHSTREVATRLEQAFERANIPIRYISTQENMRKAEEAHVYILVALLGLIIAGFAIVGAAGLAAALGTSVIERTREFGIMRAIGARSSHIYKTVISEAALIGVLSWMLALLFSIPATLILGALRKIILQPLELEWSQTAALAWLVIVLGISALAAVLPARRAANLKVGEALAST